MGLHVVVQFIRTHTPTREGGREREAWTRARWLDMVLDHPRPAAVVENATSREREGVREKGSERERERK